MTFSENLSEARIQAKANITPTFRSHWKVGISTRVLAPGLIVLFALLHGLVYLWLIPPWQYHDEPNHFEYAWLLANRSGMPEPGDYDQEMRRQVAASMIGHGFFRGMSFIPDLTQLDRPIWIGDHSQLEDPPLYYLFASFPLRLLASQPIENQLYSVRLLSLLLNLFVILAAYKIACELAPQGSGLRWMAPLALAALPPFTASMTAVNNDAGAVFVFSLFLWGAVRLVERGFTWSGLVWVAAAAAAGPFVKSSLIMTLPLFGLAVILSILKQRWKWTAWLVGIVGLVAGLGIVLTGGDAAFWYRHTFQEEAARLQSPAAQVGNWAFQLIVPGGVTRQEIPELRQFLADEDRMQLSHTPLTMGAWMWSSRPVTVRSPILLYSSGRQSYFEEVEINEAPTFFAFSVPPIEDARGLYLKLAPVAKGLDAPVTVYYDGLVLVPGKYPLDQVPVFANPEGLSGKWGGLAFYNLLRNASAETGWPRIVPWADKAGSLLISHGRPSLILYTALDKSGAGWYYRLSSHEALRSFYGKFGWGHVPLLGQKPYRPWAYATSFALLGLLVGAWRWRRGLPWHSVLFLGVALLLIWLPGLSRGTAYIWGQTFIPSARYSYPVVLVTVGFLLAGWRAWWPDKAWRYIRFIVPAVLLLLAAHAALSVWIYYRV